MDNSIISEEYGSSLYIIRNLRFFENRLMPLVLLLDFFPLRFLAKAVSELSTFTEFMNSSVPKGI